jgi:hypothetical protein
MKRSYAIVIIFSASVLSASLGTSVSLAQQEENFWTVDTNDPFNDINAPFMDGLSMWIVRQKLTLRGYQAFIGADAPTKDGAASPQGNTRIDLYLPLASNRTFSSMIGVQHYTSRILTDVQGMDIGLIHDWFWLVGSYEINNWKFLLSAEYFRNTNKNSLFSKKGDALMPLFTTGYAFSNSWQLMSLAGFRKTSMVDKEKTTPVFGMQARYQPTHAFKIILGAPVLLGSEWAVNQKLYLGCKALFTGAFSAEAFVRYSLNEHCSAGFHYAASNNELADSYFGNEIYHNGTEQIVYNNLTQICQTLSLDFGTKVSKEIALVLSGGYRSAGKAGLYYNEDRKFDIAGKDEYFVGIAVQYLSYFE